MAATIGTILPGRLVLLLCTTAAVLATPEDPLKVDYPSVIVHATQDGNFTMLSGHSGDIELSPGVNGTGRVYFEGEDLLYIFEVIRSLPPVWSDQSAFGYLGEFYEGQKVNVKIEAKDPEGGHVTYSIVAGNLPPGVTLDPATGLMKGVAPDTDATYSFTIRATDSHGKFADHVFKMKDRGSDACQTKPCSHEGICQDKLGGFHCNCIHPYGGKTCQLDCRNHGLGIDTRHKVVTDAQLSAYRTYTSYLASNGRLQGSGWYGIDDHSWLQVDLGNMTKIYGSQMQGYSSTYYTGSYYLRYSTDGDVFYNYTTTGTGHYNLAGYPNANVYTTALPQYFEARYVRFVPLSWNKSYRPFMRVELLGCYYV